MCCILLFGSTIIIVWRFVNQGGVRGSYIGDS